jgi:peptidoglycan/xylan/chitin deacetylase (PgdA/CDA1 family)
MPHYIAAYDTESPRCLEACRKIVAVHRRYEMPATFFITGTTLERNPAEYHALLDDDLFEVASHTYSHKMLRDHPFCGPAAAPEQRRVEVFEGKAWVEKVFERACVGLRPGCSFVDGLRGAPDVLALVQDAGLRYTSSVAWGPDYSLPALLVQPFPYAQDGFPTLWELPGHGWHENLLKDNNNWGSRRLTLWPPLMPEAVPPGFLVTPDEEFAVNKVFLDKAVGEGMTFVSLIWHPWSLDRFDPDMRMLELTFRHVREVGLRPCTYAGLWEQLSGNGERK